MASFDTINLKRIEEAKFMFWKKNPYEQQSKKLMKKEQKLIEKKKTKEEDKWTQSLMNKVPEKLKETLYHAFLSAFRLIFEKGTGIIEKTYDKKKQEDDYLVNELNDQLRSSKKTVRAFSKKARGSGMKNQVISGVSGIGLGLLGLGIPDIALLVGLILKGIYEIAVSYGYDYQQEEEQSYILLLIQGGILNGDLFLSVNESVNDYLNKRGEFTLDALIEETSMILADEMLVMKFIQGIPIAGVIGGAFDAIIMKKITEYADVKYQQRFLQEKIEKRSRKTH